MEKWFISILAAVVLVGGYFFWNVIHDLDQKAQQVKQEVHYGK